MTLRYQGVRKPLSDFSAVKTDLQTGLLVYEVDLSVAHSISANTAVVLRFAGNSFYIDKNTDVGNATVVFQDDSNMRPARVFVEPGFIARVPWTQLIVENAAQAGKVLRIFYGVDIDFVPGTSSDVNIAGTVNSNPQPLVYASSYATLGALAANTAQTIFSAAANVNGAAVWSASFISVNATGYARAAYVMNAVAPATVVNGAVLCMGDSSWLSTGAYVTGGKLPNPVRVPAGQGLFFITELAEFQAHRSVLYTLL